MTSKYSQPGSDQIEISVFGPGYGESILIHIGNGNWIAIDSCTDQNTKKSVPLDYIQKCGYDPSKAVKYIIASHWHDDHVQGLHELLEASTNASFSCSSVLTGKEFLTLGELLTGSNTVKSRGPRELYRCLETIQKRQEQSGVKLLQWSAADTTILLSKNLYDLRLTSLSPSNQMYKRSLDFMAGYVNAYRRGHTEPNILATLPNDVAVALLLEINGRNILLGSDLEVDKDPLCGWSAVLAGNTLLNSSKSKTFKVAHHGSITGHHDKVWSDSLESNSLALLTPFRHAAHRIPSKTERERILGLTSEAYITACPETSNKPAKKSTKVQAFLNTTVKGLRLAYPPAGHIRWRASITDIADEGQVELFDGAMHLSKVAAPISTVI